MTIQARPRVFIVDDHGLFRSGVRSELGDEVEVVGEAEDVAHSIGSPRPCPMSCCSTCTCQAAAGRPW
jgi:DNA-binding NarL/FixJ family response regulator